MAGEMTVDDRRAISIARRCITDLRLDLRGLTVYTEAASGAYLYTPVLAAIAGAEHVFALTTDSRFGTKESVREATNRLAEASGFGVRVQVVFTKTKADVGQCDIVTNSGFVRPIDREMVSWMKPTAVVPLMWETWEMREMDVDLAACTEHQIMVLGTREDRVPHSLYPYCGFTAMKLLFELGLEGYRSRVILLGGGKLGRFVYQHFVANRIEVAWFAEDVVDARPYSDLARFWLSEGSHYDAIIVGEHTVPRLLVGEHGLITTADLTTVNPSIRIGVIAGAVDPEAIRAARVRLFPPAIRPFGYMSYQPDRLGPRPVLELYAAGLRVGEAMARARLSGHSVVSATALALQQSPAMTFVDSDDQG